MRMLKALPFWILGCVLTCFLFNPSTIHAQDTRWIDFENGLWSDFGNWSNGVPGANSSAFIGIGQITQNTVGGATIRELEYDWGTSDITLDTDLTVTDHFIWGDGTISGNANLILQGTAEVNDGRLEATVESFADVDVDPFVFFNGAGGQGVWNNRAGAKFNLFSDSDLAFDSTFNNFSGGTIHKQQSGEARFNWNLNSSGLIQADSGRLSILGNSTFNGEMLIGNNATIDFGTIRDYDFGVGAQVNGTGTLELSAGTTTVDNTLNVNSDFRMDGTSTLTGSGTLNINGSLDWDSGQMLGTGVTNLNNGGLITGGGLQRTLNNFGYVDFQPFVFLSGTTSSSVWNNKDGAVVELTNDQGFAFEGTINNEQGATFRKTSSGRTSIAWDFCNDGLLDLQNGVIWFQGEFKQGNTGTIALNGGSFIADDWTLNGTIQGSGVVDSPDTVATGTLNPGNPTGTLTFDGDLTVQSTAVSNFDLGTVSDLIVVQGDLSLGGTLNLFGLDGFGAGQYVLFDYNGSFTDNGLIINSAPAGFEYSLFNDTVNRAYVVSVTTAVPEPSGIIVLSALTTVALSRRRRI